MTLLSESERARRGVREDEVKLHEHIHEHSVGALASEAERPLPSGEILSLDKENMLHKIQDPRSSGLVLDHLEREAKEILFCILRCDENHCVH